MSRRDELLDKAVAGGLDRSEAAELRGLLEKEDIDARRRALIAFGTGAAAGATLPKLLELDFLGDLLAAEPAKPEEPAPEALPAPAAQRAAPALGPSDYVPSPPEDASEEEMEKAREARRPDQVGARAMPAPQPMGPGPRRRRPPGS